MGMEKMPTRQDMDADEKPWSDEEDDDDVDVPEFPEFKMAVQEAIEQLDGAVAPKLNWSSPKDATWVSTYGSIKCTNADEVKTPPLPVVPLELLPAPLSLRPNTGTVCE
eukprot:760383-Prorocentrum_minimum.AAC.1